MTTKGIGFEYPGESDVFADGSPCKGQPSSADGLVYHTGAYMSMTERRRKINCNPPAGDVRRQELSGAWMTSHLEEIEKENAKARVVLDEKRTFGLAKQAQAGLQQIGVRYEMTSIANIIRAAYRYRALRDEGGTQRFTADKVQEGEHSLQVLDAVLQYKIYKLAELLGCPVRKNMTYGGDPALTSTLADGEI
eukprot:CAMPEP_0113945396 /NCGR_PEP_ID=MMETSP1339-20121228/45346_1 /TAXON_ID=94617 /ORGANISM="Fibrocapsa japonica" /LENGTH=192 /DNA_ID=CAMNT_0000950969 /DNA_START=54 /DNA_END=632 /DNA_ORIENTATION=- /assembly_acc=CAM_ASM_000762